MTITVTQEDIDNGIPKSCFECPVAEAIARCFPKDPVWVGKTYVSISNRSRKLPSVAKDFISDFDHGNKNLQPFSFEL